MTLPVLLPVARGRHRLVCPGVPVRSSHLPVSVPRSQGCQFVGPYFSSCSQEPTDQGGWESAPEALLVANHSLSHPVCLLTVVRRLSQSPPHADLAQVVVPFVLAHFTLGQANPAVPKACGKEQQLVRGLVGLVQRLDTVHLLALAPAEQWQDRPC